MKKLSIWMVLLLLCTLSSFAQNKNITVSGRVIEEDTERTCRDGNGSITCST